MPEAAGWTILSDGSTVVNVDSVTMTWAPVPTPPTAVTWVPAPAPDPFFGSDDEDLDWDGDDLDDDDDDDSCNCGLCYRGRGRRNCAVHRYDYRPDMWIPKGDIGVHMGVELEVGGQAGSIVDIVRELDEDEHHLYMKEDSSIDGVEIVTHPMTLSWARAYLFPTLLRELRNARCGVNDDYGLHVHVARSAFQDGSKSRKLAKRRTVTHQMTWLLFLHRNADRMQKLGRRNSTRWAKFAKPERGELARKANGRRDYSDDRYTAVNCVNSTTFELRFFKSTLDETEFFAAIEFADATVEYTRTLKSSEVLTGNGLSWDRFRRWVDAHDYPHLSSELERIAPIPVNPGNGLMYRLPDAVRVAGFGGELEYSRGDMWTVVSRRNAPGEFFLRRSVTGTRSVPLRDFDTHSAMWTVTRIGPAPALPEPVDEPASVEAPF